MANEKRLIDANALTDSLKKWLSDAAVLCNVYIFNAIEDCICEVDAMPTVDAVEVVHASWIEDGYYGNPFVCSHCGSEGCYYGDCYNKTYYYTNYCPHCGAKMDGDGDGSAKD